MGLQKKHKIFLSVFLLATVSLLFIFNSIIFSKKPHERKRGTEIKHHIVNKNNKERKISSENESQKKDPLNTNVNIFEEFKLSEAELKLFYERRFEPREATFSISGLKIDKRPFQVETEEELPEKLRIPLPSGEIKEFTRDFVDFKDTKSFVWIGRDHELETIHLSFYDSSFVGQIETENVSYEIKHLSEEKNIIREIDRNFFPEDSNDAVEITDDTVEILNEDDSVSTEESVALTTVANENSAHMIIDIVVGYSHLIKNAEGGSDAALALVNQHVAGVNTTHRNSNTGIRVNVKQTIELNVSSLSYLGGNLKKLLEAEQVRESGNSYEANNPYHTLIKIRHQTKSDLATLITERSAGVNCGSAYLLGKNIKSSSTFKRYGLSVVGANCLTGTLAHEIGHNLGCNHDREQYPEGSTQLNITLPYAFAFRSTSKRFRTVMASGCLSGCPRIFYFSDSNRKIQNVVIGETDRIDNVRSIRERATIIQNIYQSTTNKDSSGSLRITQQPQGGHVKDGGSLRLQVITTPPSGLRYQWYRDSSPLTGENGSTLALNSSSHSGNAAIYRVEVSNHTTNKVQSDSVTVYFLRKPQFIKEPESLNLSLNESAQFSLKATGHPAPTVTWYKDGNIIPNERGEILSLGKVQWFHRGIYSARLSNSEGTQTKDVHLRLKIENKWDPLFHRQGSKLPIQLGEIDRDVGIKSGRR